MGVCLHFPVNPIFTKCPYLFHPHITLKFSLSGTQNTPYNCTKHPHNLQIYSKHVRYRVRQNNVFTTKIKFSDNLFSLQNTPKSFSYPLKLPINQALSRTRPLYKEITPLTHPKSHHKISKIPCISTKSHHFRISSPNDTIFMWRNICYN